MNRSVQAGRPSTVSRGTRVPYIQDNEIMYIADDSDCEQIFQIFAKQSTYKNITKSGPRKQYTQEIDNSQIVECNQKLRELLKQIQLSEDTIFFIGSKKRDFVFENDILIDKTIYTKIKYSIFPRYYSIINKLNMVVRGLDEEFIKVLEIIVEKYISEKERGFDPEQISQNLVNFIRKNSIEDKDKDCYDTLRYLRNWESLKESTKQTRLETIKSEIYARIQQNNAKKSKKVKERHEESIQEQLKELKEEQNCTSIEYLIQNLVRCFEQILEKDQQEDQQP